MILGQIEAPSTYAKLAEALSGQSTVGIDAAKMVAFKHFGYKIYAEEVRRFHCSEARIRIVDAPARGSKSYSAFFDSAYYVMPTNPLTSSLHWYVGPDYKTNKEFQYAYELFHDERERLGLGSNVERAVNNPSNGEMRIVLNWGKDAKGRIQRAVIEGKSATNARSLQGEEVTTAIMSEACEQSEEILTKYLGSRTWKIIMPSTPKPYAQWVKDLIDLSSDSALGIDHFHFPPEANPNYRPPTAAEPQGSLAYQRWKMEEAKAASRTESGRAEDDHFFAEQFLGLWVYYTGRVIPFQTQRHVVRTDPPGLPAARKFLSIDYGYDHPAAVIFWAIFPSGALLIWDAFKLRHASQLDIVEEIERRLAAREFHLDYVTGDPKRGEVAELFTRSGFPIFDINKNYQSSRAAGHHRLADLLSDHPSLATPQHPQGRPRLYVHGRCEDLIREWQTLRYREGRHADEFSKNALEGEDDFYDAAKYGVMTLPSAYQPEAGEDRWEYLREQQRLRQREWNTPHEDFLHAA